MISQCIALFRNGLEDNYPDRREKQRDRKTSKRRNCLRVFSFV